VLRSSFPIVYVDDVLVSMRFDREVLGFEEIYRFPDPDEPGYVSLRVDAGKLGLSRADFPGIHGNPQRPITGRPFELCVDVADVDAFVRRLRKPASPFSRSRRTRCGGARCVCRRPGRQPHGDFANVHRCAVLAAESRAGQRTDTDVELTAAHLHGMLDG